MKENNEGSKKDGDDGCDERIPAYLRIKILLSEIVFLVEGKSDESFVEEILKEIKCDVKYAIWSVGGNCFHKVLPAILATWLRESYKNRKIVIVTDNDEHGTFEEIRQNILKELAELATDEDLPPDFKIPECPDQFAGGTPDCCIIMLPDANQKGCLETLLLAAAKETHPKLYDCAKAYYACVLENSQEKWSPSKRAKLFFRVMFAAHHKRNPDLSVTHLWKDCPDLAPIKSEVFDGVKGRLRQLLKSEPLHSPPPPPGPGGDKGAPGIGRPAVKAPLRRRRRGGKE